MELFNLTSAAETQQTQRQVSGLRSQVSGKTECRFALDQTGLHFLRPDT